MTEKELAGVLKVACEQVPFGIYAIRKKDYIELRNDKMSKTQLKQRLRELRSAGYKVYFNKGN